MTAAIALGTLIAAVAPLYAMYLTLRRNADADYETALERRVDRLTNDLAGCRERNKELSEENLQLMRKLLAQPEQPAG